MAALWFYRAAGPLHRFLSAVTGEPWSDVAIAHTVTDVSVVSVSHPRRGVWCSPQSKARKADEAVYLPVPDDFTTQWFVYRWGVKFSWLDIFIPPSARHLDRIPTATELARQFIVDAADQGHVIPGASVLRNAKRVSASELYRAISTGAPRLQ